jgi:hypothetical protein
MCTARSSPDEDNGPIGTLRTFAIWNYTYATWGRYATGVVGTDHTVLGCPAQRRIGITITLGSESMAGVRDGQGRKSVTSIRRCILQNGRQIRPSIHRALAYQTLTIGLRAVGFRDPLFVA